MSAGHVCGLLTRTYCWQPHVAILQLGTWNHSRISFAAYARRKCDRKTHPRALAARKHVPLCGASVHNVSTIRIIPSLRAIFIHRTRPETGRNCVQAVDSLKTCNEIISQHRTSCSFPVILFLSFACRNRINFIISFFIIFMEFYYIQGFSIKSVAIPYFGNGPRLWKTAKYVFDHFERLLFYGSWGGYPFSKWSNTYFAVFHNFKPFPKCRRYSVSEI